LSACAATGAKVKFIGTGEKLEQIELYNPERILTAFYGGMVAKMESNL
jgi:signal recognition particle subunit SRP54